MNTLKRKQEARGEVTCTLSLQIKPEVWSWTESATCSGSKRTKSGVRNISTATSVTSTSCLLLPSSVFLPLLLLSGSKEKEAEVTRAPTRNHAIDSKVDGRMDAPLHPSHPATAAPLHLTLQVTAAPRDLSRRAKVAPLRLIRPATAAPLRLNRPLTDAPPHQKTEFRRGHLQRAVRKRFCRKEIQTTSS